MDSIDEFIRDKTVAQDLWHSYSVSYYAWKKVLKAVSRQNCSQSGLGLKTSLNNMIIELKYLV